MYAEVIPYDASFGTEALTYEVGDSFVTKLQIGHLVKIPYGKKIISGIVCDIFSTKNTDTELKSIQNIVYDMPILSAYQLEIIIKISKKYLLPIHRVLQIFVPTRLIARLEKYQILWENYEKYHNDAKIFFENAFQNSDNFLKNHYKNTIFFAKNTNIDAHILQKFTQPKTVIVVPDDIFLEQIRPYFENQKTLFYSNEMTETQKSKAWIDAYFAKYPVIVGTRRILFANLWKYENIFYVEDGFFRQYFHYPISINYIDILAFLSDNNQFWITIFTSAPRLDTLFRFHFFTLQSL